MPTRIHVVKWGDTLPSIARTYYGDVNYAQVIYDANRELLGDDPNEIQPYQQLTIPYVKAVTVGVDIIDEDDT